LESYTDICDCGKHQNVFWSFTAFSYMDSVPVKISEQYKPPRKITLPVSRQHRFSVETAAEEVRYSDLCSYFFFNG